MSIKDFELFHGVVLTRLVRSDKPLTLRMIETHDDSWGVYKINDEVELFIKHSTSPRKLSRGKGGWSWVFHFSLEHIKLLKEIQTSRPVYIALVCGRKEIKRRRMEICFLEPDDFAKVIDLSKPEAQSVTIRYEVGKKNFRAFLNREEIALSSLNAIDRWQVPGN
jgi:hypothetical protein